jgi:hypothetical protein
MKINFLKFSCMPLFVSISPLAFSQIDRYEESGGSMGLGGFVIFIVAPLIFAFVFGTGGIRKGILRLFLLIVCGFGYLYGLIEFAKYVQYIVSPVKHGVGLVFFLVFITGWFVPIWIWSKMEK